jgi:hypothetical protein
MRKRRSVVCMSEGYVDYRLHVNPRSTNNLEDRYRKNPRP